MNPMATTVGVITLLLAALSVADEQNSRSVAGFADAVLGGQPRINLRYRYEHVDDDSFGQDADASTLRLRLNYGTGKWRGWSAFTEYDYIAELLLNDFNSGAGTSSTNRNQHPTVADPRGADLNQFYSDYDGFSDVRLRFRRQRILLDNQRVVRAVGWRKNEQTYDGVTVSLSGLPRTAMLLK